MPTSASRVVRKNTDSVCMNTALNRAAAQEAEQNTKSFL